MLNVPFTREYCLKILLNSLNGQRIDKVIGAESRGFFFGMLLADRLNAGFVPVRKAKKLPFKTISASYDLIWNRFLGNATDAIKKGDKVLIHDNVLATGGTAKALSDLVHELGGEIVQFNFLMELSFLNGKEKIKEHSVFAAITY